MVQQKDTAIAKQQRRQMAHLLEQGKEESARIRVENIIRSDITTELLEILELYCELLLARIGLLEPKECDPGLEEAIKSIIHAAPRTDVKELQQARQLLVEKYGKEFALEAVDNSDGKVAERVVKKLKVEPPDPVLVDLYLKEIAKTYVVDWPKGQNRQHHRSDEEEDDDDPSSGQAVKNLEGPLTTEELSKATPPRDLGPKSPVSIASPSPSTDNLNPRVKLPGPPDLRPSTKMSGLKKQTPSTQTQSDPKGMDVDEPGKKGVGGKIPDVDELARRFAALKNCQTYSAKPASLFITDLSNSLSKALNLPQPLSLQQRSTEILSIVSSMSEGKSGRWTEAEKAALMVSIVASFGSAPVWSKVKLPAGRSRMACMHIYYAAMEEAKGVPLGDTKNADAVKKRGPKRSSTKTSPQKGKRGRKTQEETVHESDVSEDEGPTAKKVKMEDGGYEEKAAELDTKEV
ncbi:MAG: hypothetical protein Q9166_001516 [cf. Caloplaca sp. 2 TL-2023]